MKIYVVHILNFIVRVQLDFGNDTFTVSVQFTLSFMVGTFNQREFP